MSVPVKSRVSGKELVAFFQLLSNVTRLRIITDLEAGEKCVCNIFKNLKLPQNLISHHLGILRKKNIIKARRAGKWVYYSLNEERLSELRRAFQDIHKAPKNTAGRKPAPLKSKLI